MSGASRKSRRGSVKPKTGIRLPKSLQLQTDNSKTPKWATRVYSGKTPDVRIQWEKFESTMGFSVTKHISDYFSKVDINEAKAHKQVLEDKQRQTSDQLKKYVTHNYPQFIHISNEIMDIEGDMAKLTTMLGSYRGLMKTLQRTNFDFSAFDSEESNELPILSTHMYADLGKTLPQRIDDLCEEVGILVYQCKYGKAVDRIADARKLLEEMEAKNPETRPMRLASQITVQSTYTPKESKAGGAAASTGDVQKMREAIEVKVRDTVTALLGELRRAQGSKGAWNAGDLSGVRIIRYLLRLGRTDEALEILLTTRSAALRQEVRGIKFQGDAPQYIGALSNVVFKGIATCVEEFTSIFSGMQSNPMMSTVVQWTIEELEDFAKRFATQISEARSNFTQLGQCLRSAFKACGSLDVLGLHLAFVLAKRLHPVVQHAIVRSMRRVVQQITNKPSGEISREKWLSKKLVIKEYVQGDGGRRTQQKKEIRLTSSAIYLYNAVRTLLEADLPLVINEDVLPYSTVALYGTVAKGVIGLLDEVITCQAKTATKTIPKENEEQHLSILANFQYLLADLLPRIEKSLSLVFNRRGAAEVTLFEERLKELSKALVRSFCKRRAEIWINLVQWNSKVNAARYGIRASEKGMLEDEKNMTVSEPFVNLLERIYVLMDNVASHLKRRATDFILSDALDIFFKQVALQERFRGVRVSALGLQQVFLDISFLLKATDGLLLDSALRNARSVIDAAKMQCADASQLNQPEFFNKKIAEQLRVTVPLKQYTAVDRQEKKRKNKGRQASSAQLLKQATRSAAKK
mmetsp:Transcript_27712/g.53933  ORF Transcript_27712/g.53933 Transcript_27712/m.53933 type:complete len:805 (+) Transcript_27712:64-2478(+)